MLRVQSFSQSWDVAFHLSPDINVKQISSCSAFPSVCSATMPSHSGEHFRMVVKPGMGPDFLENIFTPNIIFVFLRDHLYIDYVCQCMHTDYASIYYVHKLCTLIMCVNVCI